MTNTNDNRDFPEVEALGLAQDIPSFADPNSDDVVTGEWAFKNRRDPSTYEPFPLDVFPPITRRYVGKKRRVV